jgi:WD40 repeat protein
MDHPFTARLLAQLGDFAGEITALAVSSTGRSISIASEDAQLSLWSIPSCSLVKGVILQQDVHSLTYSGDGLFLAAGLANGDVWIGTNEGEHLETIKQIGRATLAFVPNSSVLAVITWKGVLQLWQIQPLHPLFTHVFASQKGEEVPWQVSISSDGAQTAIASGKEKSLHILQLNLLGRQETVQHHHQFSHLKIAYHSELHYHPTEQHIVFLHDDSYPKGIVGLDTRTGSCISRISLPRIGSTGQFCFSPKKEYLAVTDGDGSIHICSLKKQQVIGSFPAHHVKGGWSYQYCLMYAIEWVSSPLGNILITAGWGKGMERGKERVRSTVKLWHVDL